MEHADYRIIDANFNRAREALRVVEDYCRFALDSNPLSSRAKELRHQLCSALSCLDGISLLVGRDTQGDVGIGRQVKTTPGRTDLKGASTAACKRLPEALRVLAETLRPASPDLADKIEKIRYAGYTLEKDVALFADTHARFAGVRLYVVISSNLPADVFALTNKCIQGGADCIQLRAKDIDADKYFAIAAEFVKICKDARILSVINDRVDIAAASGADGVHLGQNDLPLEQARKLQRIPLIFGKSTHNPAELTSAIAELPTYVSLGPIFATPTKPKLTPVTLDYVKQALPIISGTGVWHVTIGGITEQNIDSVLRAGAKTIAVSSAVTASPDPAAACKKLKEKIGVFFNSYPP
ncbi:MAG: thiamine phosphate synthase [Sedimentisphaerales bacterium]|nr:thiamine phosphate synthase [Sedimentisphaerales bacterium]